MKEEDIKALSESITNIINMINDIKVVLKEANEDKAREYTNTLLNLLLKYIELVNKLKSEGYVIK